MKPAWDKLMKDFAGSSGALIADVDCTAEGKPLCDANGVQGFPTIKWGDPSALEKYEGGRDYDALKKFADENLKPRCGPGNLDLCDEEQTAEINAIIEMDMSDLEAEIAKGNQEMEDAETTFKTELQKLQDKYQKLQKDKQETQDRITASGLGLKKSVAAHRRKVAADKDEL